MAQGLDVSGSETASAIYFTSVRLTNTCRIWNPQRFFTASETRSVTFLCILFLHFRYADNLGYCGGTQAPKSL
jgi:hypothetical protein